MYGYYAGDNERNDYDTIEQMDTNNVNLEIQDKRLHRAPSVDYNHKMMKKKHTSQIDLEKAKREAEELLKEGDVNQIMKDKLMFEQKSVNLFKMYGHLFEPIDWIFLVFAIIGSIGAGISMPIMSYFTSDVYSDVGNTSESITAEDIALMREAVEIQWKTKLKNNLSVELFLSCVIF